VQVYLLIDELDLLPEDCLLSVEVLPCLGGEMGIVLHVVTPLLVGPNTLDHCSEDRREVT